MDREKDRMVHRLFSARCLPMIRLRPTGDHPQLGTRVIDSLLNEFNRPTSIIIITTMLE